MRTVPVDGAASLYTKEDWRKIVVHTPMRPPALSRDERLALSDVDNRRVDRAVRAYHLGLGMLRSPEYSTFEASMDQVLEGATGATYTASPGVALSGQARTGKTTKLMMRFRDYERQVRADYGWELPPPGEPIDWGATNAGADFLPVVFTTVNHGSGGRDFMTGLLNFTGAPVRRGGRASGLGRTVGDLKLAFADMAKACGTRVVVIDEFHNLNLRNSRDAAVSSLIKDLMNHTPWVTYVLAGIDLPATGLLDDGTSAQTGGRVVLVETHPMLVDTPEGRAVYKSLLHNFESRFLLRDARRGDLVRHWEYVHHRTGGLLGQTADYLRMVANRALVRDADSGGRERITEELLEATAASASADRAAGRGAAQHAAEQAAELRADRRSGAAGRGTVA